MFLFLYFDRNEQKVREKLIMCFSLNVRLREDVASVKWFSLPWFKSFATDVFFFGGVIFISNFCCVSVLP